MMILHTILAFLAVTVGCSEMDQPPADPPPSTERIATLLAAYQGRAVDPQYLHVVPVSSFPGLLVVGQQVTTHSADLQAVVLWDDQGAELGQPSEMVAPAMTRAGWIDADTERRQSLAMDWVRNVELRFAGTVQDKELAFFGTKGRAKFQPPTALSLRDGGVEVRLWYREVERGKSSTRGFCHLRVHFAVAGEISDRQGEDCFRVPNQEWRKAL